MTKPPAHWRAAAHRARLMADQAENTATRYDRLSEQHASREDSLVADVWAEAALRALADADQWRNAASRFSAYADEAELPVTLTVVGAA